MVISSIHPSLVLILSFCFIISIPHSSIYIFSFDFFAGTQTLDKYNRFAVFLFFAILCLLSFVWCDWRQRSDPFVYWEKDFIISYSSMFYLCTFLLNRQTNKNVEPHRLFWLNSTIPHHSSCQWQFCIQMHWACFIVARRISFPDVAGRRLTGLVHCNMTPTAQVQIKCTKAGGLATPRNLRTLLARIP